MRHVGQAAQRPDQRSAEGQVGHEVPIHHVDVEPLRAAGHRPLDLFAKPAEIGAQARSARF